MALTSSRLETLSPYRWTSIPRSITTADHSSHLVIISSPLNFFLHCFSIGIHISLLIKKETQKLSLIFISTCRIYLCTSFQTLTSSMLSHLSFEYLISLPQILVDSPLAYTILSKENINFIAWNLYTTMTENTRNRDHHSCKPCRNSLLSCLSLLVKSFEEEI